MDRDTAIQDAKELSDEIMSIYSISNVISFGCGTGRLLYPYHEKGVSVHGIDASSSALENSQLPSECLEQHDITQPYHTDSKFDLALAIEILEHLPQEAADIAVRSIANSARVIIVSAARPGQGGTHHVNEQNRDYWIKKFKSEGMKVNLEATNKLVSKIDLNDLEWIRNNLLVFEEDG